MGQNGSEGWRQGSPFLLVARVCCCRHQCQGRQTWGDDDGQCSVAASSDIGILLGAPGCSTWPRPRRWNLGLLLSAKVALFPLIIAAAGGRARAGLMSAETLGPTSPLDHNNAAPQLLLRCLTDVGAPRLRSEGKTTLVRSFRLLSEILCR